MTEEDEQGQEIEHSNDNKQESGETYKDKNGDLRWAAANTQGKKVGSLAEKPRALIPFDSQTASLASQKRWAGRQRAAETGLIKAAAEYLGVETHELSADEAHGLLVYVQSLKGLEGNTAAAKFASVAADSLPRAVQQEEQRVTPALTIVNFNFRSLGELRDYVEQQREAGRIANAAFIEAQVREITDEGPVQVDVLWGKDD